MQQHLNMWEQDGCVDDSSGLSEYYFRGFEILPWTDMNMDNYTNKLKMFCYLWISWQHNNLYAQGFWHNDTLYVFLTEWYIVC